MNVFENAAYTYFSIISDIYKIINNSIYKVYKVRANEGAMSGEETYNTERNLYLLLRRQGPSTLSEISMSLGISKMGALKWINKLESQGKIERKIKKLDVGRPAFVFSLTPESNIQGDNTGSEKILMDLLNFIKRMQYDDIADEFLRQRYERFYSEVFNKFQGKDFSTKLDILRELRERDGYMPEIKQNPSENYNLIEYNCPIYRISSVYPIACELERRLFEDLLGTQVENSHRQTNGKNNCVFSIKRRGRD